MASIIEAKSRATAIRRVSERYSARLIPLALATISAHPKTWASIRAVRSLRSDVFGRPLAFAIRLRSATVTMRTPVTKKILATGTSIANIRLNWLLVKFSVTQILKTSRLIFCDWNCIL